MYGTSARQLRYQGSVQAGEGVSCRFRYLLCDIYRGGLCAWCLGKLLARQSFGDLRSRRRYHRLIEWTILVGCLLSVRLLQIRSVLSLLGRGPCAHLTWTFS